MKCVEGSGMFWNVLEGSGRFWKVNERSMKGHERS
jgi:hypothetical protein